MRLSHKRWNKQVYPCAETVVNLSGKRRNPFQVRVNTCIDEWGYPRYDALRNFPDRVSAEIALAEYNKSPYDVGNRKKTF